MAKKVQKPLEAKIQNNLPSQSERNLEDEISRKIGPLIQTGSREQVISRVVAIIKEEYFRGPIAHPKHLEQYEQICPGAADRIIKMAEDSLACEIEVIQTSQSGEASYRTLGMWLGFASLIALVLASLVSGWLDKPYLAGGFLAAGVVGVVGKFIAGVSGRGRS